MTRPGSPQAWASMACTMFDTLIRRQLLIRGHSGSRHAGSQRCHRRKTTVLMKSQRATPILLAALRAGKNVAISPPTRVEREGGVERPPKNASTRNAILFVFDQCRLVSFHSIR